MSLCEQPGVKVKQGGWSQERTHKFRVHSNLYHQLSEVGQLPSSPLVFLHHLLARLTLFQHTLSSQQCCPSFDLLSPHYDRLSAQSFIASLARSQHLHAQCPPLRWKRKNASRARPRSRPCPLTKPKSSSPRSRANGRYHHNLRHFYHRRRHTPMPCIARISSRTLLRHKRSRTSSVRWRRRKVTIQRLWSSGVESRFGGGVMLSMG